MKKLHKYIYESYITFIVGIEDSDVNFQIRLVSINGTEIFRSQIVNIQNSDDFYLYGGYSYDKDGIKKSIIVIVFYENQFEIHQ